MGETALVTLYMKLTKSYPLLQLRGIQGSDILGYTVYEAYLELPSAPAAWDPGSDSLGYTV